MSRTSKWLFASVVAAAVLVAVWVPWSRYTNLGIFAGGGGNYWVRQAAAASSDAEATSHLHRVLRVNQYGVNVAENSVRALPRKADRIRLWRLLIGLAPNDNWRAIYSRRLANETAPAAGEHGA
jgi:hypothetical protein